MNYLALDTTGSGLILAARSGERVFLEEIEDGAGQHSVRLMPEIDALLRRASLAPSDCDFFACAVGPGSFTGIRIGISTVKGLCLALEKPALAVTSFDVFAYAETGGRRLVLIDAGRGAYYACGYGEGNARELPPARISAEEVQSLLSCGWRAVKQADRAKGLSAAVEALAANAQSARGLEALYLRRSAAEENR